MKVQEKLHYLEDKWDDKLARTLTGVEGLRYRSNLLGSDLRITNFGGGNTSSKATEKDPLDGSDAKVLWVKGSGGDLGSMKASGFAGLYLDKLHALERRYRGPAFEDEMVGLYPLCNFDNNTVASSIDTPLHGFLPFAHVDHLHPDWGIALAASANGKEKMEEFNRRFEHRLIWLPWQRPGFELGMMLRRAVTENRGCDGIVLGGHGLFTWGDTQHDCYLNTITIIDQLGQFVLEHVEKKGDHDLRRPSARNAAGSSRAGAGHFSFHSRPGVVPPAHDRQLQRSPGSAALYQLERCFAAGPPGDQLSGSFRAYKDPPAVCVLGAEYSACRPARSHRSRAQNLPRRIQAVLRLVRSARLARHARCKSHRGAGSRHRHVQLRQEQNRSSHHRRVLRERHSRDGRRHRYGGRRTAGRASAGWRCRQNGSFCHVCKLRGAASL